MQAVSLMYDEFYLLTFSSTHEAMDAEVQLKVNGITKKIIPLPTQVSASCGLSIKVLIEEREKIYSFLTMTTIKYDEIYYVTQKKLSKLYQKISIGDLR